MHTISQNGLNLIKHFEGCKLKAYKCPAGIWTIGYGHTKDVKANQTISIKKAEELLKQDLILFEKAINELINVNLTQNQYDALVSFTYNTGINSLKQSTLRKLLNKGNYNEVPNQLNRWVYANRKKLAGLVRRRKSEGYLFSTGNLCFNF